MADNLAQIIFNWNAIKVSKKVLCVRLIIVVYSSY
jgi:hypothetical protein